MVSVLPPGIDVRKLQRPHSRDKSGRAFIRFTKPSFFRFTYPVYLSDLACSHQTLSDINDEKKCLCLTNIAIRRDTAAHNSKTPRSNHYSCQPSLVLGGDSADRESSDPRHRITDSTGE